MGVTSYSVSSRSLRASTAGYTTVTTATMDTVFEQNRLREIHESMDPKTIKIREARDSETHPNTIPIILGLDLTGSMRGIPVALIKDGLPKLMGGIIQKGLPDPALLFIGVGDHECDNAPLQVGQFESGDEELDTWLTRTWVEGGGGGNSGESYLLAWYFAARHTVTDAWEKRKQKGFLFTIGDEPCLRSLPKNVMQGLMTESSLQGQVSYKELLKEAQEKYNVYHLHVMEGSAGPRSLNFWKDLLGQNCITIEDYNEIPNVISNIVSENSTNLSSVEPESNTSKTEEEIL